MGKDIVSLIVEDLIKGLPKREPAVINIYGGGDVCQEVIECFRERTGMLVTEAPMFVDVYSINLDYFIRFYEKLAA